MLVRRFSSPHLRLRYLARSDLDEIVTMLQKRSVCEHLFFGPNTREQTLAYFRPLLSEIEADLARGFVPQAPVFALLQPETREFMGTCALLPVDYAGATWMLGYQIDEPYWRRGHGTWAARFSLYHALLTLGARRVIADCFARNTASVKILEAIGMRREGVQREHYVKDGTPVDNLAFGLLRREADIESIGAWGRAFTTS